MTLSRIEKIRAILEEQDKPKETPTFNSGALYAHWNLNAGDSCVVRFLPDGNTSNTLPWVENQQINLTFPGIVGQVPQNVKFKVPCVEMWGLACPILGRIRKEKWFDDADLEKLGSQYWKKRSWIMQGFIVEDGIKEEETPENPIRRFLFSKQIFTKVRAGFTNPDIDASIDDYDEGLDFTIFAEANGKWNDYSTSEFKRKSRSLSDAERNAIEEHGLFDLEEFRPKKPTDSELEEIFAMFEASVNGEYYDPDRWGHLPWRPRGIDQKDEQKASSAPKVPTKSAPKKEVVIEDREEEHDEEVAEKVDTASKTQDILAKIRAQQAKG